MIVVKAIGVAIAIAGLALFDKVVQAYCRAIIVVKTIAAWSTATIISDTAGDIDIGAKSVA